MAAATAQGTYINPMAAITQLPAHTINGINGINGIGNGVVPPPTSGNFLFSFHIHMEISFSLCLTYYPPRPVIILSTF